MATDTLSVLQRDFLAEFFRRESRFFLSGGAALVGFHLFHRETYDLDLFTLEDALAGGFAAVNDTAQQLGATVEAMQTAPDFRRLSVRRGNEAVVVDLVRERVFQTTAEKPVINGIRIDPPEEILANAGIERARIQRGKPPKSCA